MESKIATFRNYLEEIQYKVLSTAKWHVWLPKIMLGISLKRG